MNKDEKEKRTFKELWNNKRTHALIVLGLWFLFFALTFIVLGIASLFAPKKNNYVSNEPSEKEVEVVEANIIGMLENLKNSNYNYTFKISSDDGNIMIYNGEVNDSSNIGYYENNDLIVKYSVSDNIYYELKGEELVLNSNIITDEIKNNIDINVIISDIKNYENANKASIIENIYTYQINDNYVISVSKNSKSIDRIVINKENINYELEFKNVNNR